MTGSGSGLQKPKLDLTKRSNWSGRKLDRRSKPVSLTLEQLDEISAVRLGFTGTETELDGWDTTRILACLLALVRRWPKAVWVTGGCVGVDTFIAMVGDAAGIHVHVVLPADRSKVDPDWQWYCSSYYEMPEGTKYMDRNDELVRRSTHMGAAFPRTPEVIRSGTWATVRRFRGKVKNTKRIVILDDRGR